MSSEWTYRHILDVFLEYVTVSIHTILYVRKIYPEELFIRAKKYNTPVYQCRHPDVCTWINDAIQGVFEELKKNTVERLNLVILSSLDIPLEKFVWDVSSLPVIPAGDIDSPIVDARINKTALEDSFRAAIIRTAYSDGNLSPLPEDCTYTITIELRDGHTRPGTSVPTSRAELTKESTSPWMPEERQPLPGEKPISIGGSTVPIRNVDVGPVRFEMWAEEARVKGKLPRRDDEDQK